VSRVLLFVSNGDGRPKCVGRAFLQGFRDGIEHHNLGGTGRYGTARMTRLMARADRWWLVSCENAEAGRHCIAGGCEPYRCHRADGPLSCRILASGGRS